MREYIGLEARMFADQELVGGRVRLLGCVALGPGMALHRGECFRVDGIDRCLAGQRYLHLTNARARKVPMRIDLLELLFEWPVVRGTHGR